MYGSFTTPRSGFRSLLLEPDLLRDGRRPHLARRPPRRRRDPPGHLAAVAHGARPLHHHSLGTPEPPRWVRWRDACRPRVRRAPDDAAAAAPVGAPRRRADLCLPK